MTAVRLLAPSDPDPRDWKILTPGYELEVRVEIVSECVYVGVFDDGSNSGSQSQLFQLEVSEARLVAEKVLAACALVEGIPSRPFA